MKTIPCQLILHGPCKQLSGGKFDSIAAAKKYVRECWEGPYTIVRLGKKINDSGKLIRND
jgi:tRNA A37 threonylcarbamoyladenosine synthetase subunit TsaC/SUA5/YrdC